MIFLANSLIYNLFYDILDIYSRISEVPQMAYKISDDCVNCGACESECPAGAISEKDGKRVINPDQCAGCGSCASACPTGAISEE